MGPQWAERKQHSSSARDYTFPGNACFFSRLGPNSQGGASDHTRAINDVPIAIARSCLDGPGTIDRRHIVVPPYDPWRAPTASEKTLLQGKSMKSCRLFCTAEIAFYRCPSRGTRVAARPQGQVKVRIGTQYSRSSAQSLYAEEARGCSSTMASSLRCSRGCASPVAATPCRHLGCRPARRLPGNNAVPWPNAACFQSHVPVTCPRTSVSHFGFHGYYDTPDGGTRRHQKKKNKKKKRDQRCPPALKGKIFGVNAYRTQTVEQKHAPIMARSMARPES